MIKNELILTGVKETIRDLKNFDKDALKEFNKVLNSELRTLKSEAQQSVSQDPPLSGWNTQPARNPRSRGGAGWPSWDQSIIRAGISSSKAEGKVKGDYTTSVASLKNRSAAGVIYEVAGRKNKTGGKRGFISNLSRKDSQFMPSRLVWNVVDRNRGQAAQKIYDAFEKAKSKLQAKLNSRS
jgi:hypothetical protein